MVILKNLKDTEKFAGGIAKELEKTSSNMWRKVFKGRKEALVVCLSGELGAGKTALVKYFAKTLGVKEHITSPTFVIIKTYKLKTLNFKTFVHIDAYRLKSGKELVSLGFKELLKDSDNLIFLEWPENVKTALPKKSVTIYLKVLGRDKREAKMKIRKRYD